MVSREHIRSPTIAATAGLITLLLIFSTLICGCLQIEPEELPPQTVSPLAPITESPTVPASTVENTSSTPPAVVITSPKQIVLFTEQDFPPEIERAVSDFADGKTTDTINGFLRWDSVRARTNQSDAARIREQISRIDYAVYNTTIKENISVYIGISREQAKRIRNDSVYEEPGYIIASYDPSVVYQRLANTGRDSEGYLTMCVIDFRKGNRLLFVNATEREFILPHGAIWDVAREETYEQLEYSADSIPRYEDTIPIKVRLVYTKEHP
jgi:hypothetical protein